MMKGSWNVLAIACSVLLINACAPTSSPDSGSPPAPNTGMVQTTQQSLEGKIVGISERAKSLSVQTGKGQAAQTTMFQFTAETKGMQQAAQGREIIVIYQEKGNDRVATEVKLKLAQVPEGVQEISTEELEALLEEKVDLFLVDARPTIRYDQGHLPGAHSIPLPVLKEKKAAVLPAHKERLLVFYCGGITCPLSPNSAIIAQKLGYTNIRVYNQGEPSWSEEGLPTYSTLNFIQKGNVVLIDIRPSEQAVQGRIQGAYSVPFPLLEERLGDLPRNAPIVLYGPQDQLFEAVELIRDEGFKQVSLVKGGFSQWVKGNHPIDKGPIFNTEIRWERKLGKGEVSVADFRKAASGEDPGAVIVDARTKEEVNELGTFKNTIHIPLDEIPQRMHELPRNKKIYVHCATGARADMAYNELKKHGFDVKFLLLNISDAACDCEIIRP